MPLSTPQEPARLERIRRMETALREASAAVEALIPALKAYQQALPQLQALSAYYQSPLFLEDYDADRAGALPADLPRGVLSEDGIDTLLWRQTQLTELLQALLQQEPNGQ